MWFSCSKEVWQYAFKLTAGCSRPNCQSCRRHNNEISVKCHSEYNSTSQAATGLFQYSNVIWYAQYLKKRHKGMLLCDIAWCIKWSTHSSACVQDTSLKFILDSDVQAKNRASEPNNKPHHFSRNVVTHSYVDYPLPSHCQSSSCQ